VSDTILSVILAAVALVFAIMVVRMLRDTDDGPPPDEDDTPRPWDRPRAPPGPSSSGGGDSEEADLEESDKPSQPRAQAPSLPRIRFEEDEELEITKMTVLPADDDDEEEATGRYQPSVVPIVYDEDAAVEEPTQQSAYILVSAVGQTDPGKRRRRNEDAYLIIQDPPLFVVADGMGGYAGGDVASKLAVETFAEAFASDDFDPDLFPGLSRRAAALVQVIQRANKRIHDEGKADPELRGMGTTLVCARFSPNKQRVYIGHVGDSRCYVLRDNALHRITTDHTAAQLGVVGRMGESLTRALGVSSSVLIDVILGKPRAGDRYLLCSDGLSKMVPNDRIQEILLEQSDPTLGVEALIEAANASGGKDNITVILVRVDPPPSSLRPKEA
jgi:protein phosphatase